MAEYITAICANPRCLKEFKKKAGTNKRFCSLECGSRATSNSLNARKRRDRDATQICPICYNEFSAYRAKIYCSNECKAEAKRRRPQKEKIEEKEIFTKICANKICKREFKTTKRRKIYCSKDCRRFVRDEHGRHHLERMRALRGGIE